MLALISSFAIEDSSIYQIKQLNRDVSLVDGTYYKEVTRMQIKPLIENPPMTFFYAIPFHFYKRVSFMTARNSRTSEILNVSIVRRDEFRANLFFLKVELDALPPAGEQLQLMVEYHVATGATYSNKFTSIFTNHSELQGSEVEQRTKDDRKLEATFAAQCPQIYDISSQKTTVKLPAGTYLEHNTSFSPVIYKADKIEIGPNEYLAQLEFDNITIKYSALYPTMNVSSKRSVFPSGLPVRIGEFENQLGRVHILDELNFTNTDPEPEGLRESRLHIFNLRQQQNRMIHEITVQIPKAENIRVFDRVGKVASVKITHSNNITTLVIQPRHELFGGDMGQIKIEYDAIVMEQQKTNIGLTMLSTPKLVPNSFYNKVEVCVYPPSTSKNVKFYAGFPVEFEEDSKAMKSLDIEERNGKCFGRHLSSNTFAERQFGLKFEIDEEKIVMRFAVVAAAIAATVMGAWLIRLAM
ncbi:Dolichyl-diphosphooligosaccharide--protein_glycosyltransferase subunit 1 [Hexamita inflata]|uniref:Dolichyl-diphosphooligosaccharide--protein glycosyltransferase subunit 1 n=1 Tax=Hexamita inflata TaxID=28002 RepID=A0AA86Q228_9EUKA|nr:Dolichyl-diphosphooligosaccharide--protein glycosyltransferase subunit 1 [Hexamita inflata]CAI9938863.1 Dolichyl-diphosphooligosaccharide--protein glycosyltransferase subunit 1 [Hexamita inflata]CAI9949221.1 Dolichyl-diphosphooligosaccharide--protein glycosyltransferase subunit 1 [Hexamita inflata]